MIISYCYNHLHIGHCWLYIMVRLFEFLRLNLRIPCLFIISKSDHCTSIYNRYNNMAHPEWGSVDNRLTRKTPASYRWKYFSLFFGMSRTVQRQRQKMADQWHCQTIETWVCSDGVYTMDQGSKQRPSPRSLSQAFMQVWISIFGGIIFSSSYFSLAGYWWQSFSAK